MKGKIVSGEKKEKKKKNPFFALFCFRSHMNGQHNQQGGPCDHSAIILKLICLKLSCHPSPLSRRTYKISFSGTRKKHVGRFEFFVTSTHRKLRRSLDAQNEC
jgi:hypothetical protein